MKQITEKQDWNEYVMEHAGEAGAFLQSWEWGEMQKDLGHEVMRYATSEARVQLIEMGLPMGQKYHYVARGPVGVSPQASLDMVKLVIDELDDDMFVRVDQARELGVHELEARSHAVKDVQPSTTLITDLSHGEAEMFEEMHQKTRYNIRLAEKKGVEVQIGVDALEVFVALVKETSERHGIRAHGEEHYVAMMKRLDGVDGAPRAFVAIASHEDDVLAAAMCVDWNGTRTYLHGASSTTKKNLMAPYLLHWTLMDDAKTHGLHAYDWAGIAPEGSEGHPLEGVTRFKKGFGGTVVSSPQTVDLVIRSMWYWVYSVIRKFR